MPRIGSSLGIRSRSYVAEWIGAPLAEVLRTAGIMPQVRYVVYFSIQST